MKDFIHSFNRYSSELNMCQGLFYVVGMQGEKWTVEGHYWAIRLSVRPATEKPSAAFLLGERQEAGLTLRAVLVQSAATTRGERSVPGSSSVQSKTFQGAPGWGQGLGVPPLSLNPWYQLMVWYSPAKKFHQNSNMRKLGNCFHSR